MPHDTMKSVPANEADKDDRTGKKIDMGVELMPEEPPEERTDVHENDVDDPTKEHS